MSRNALPLSETTQVISGSDHAIGYFVDITDKRYAASDDDHQGEGFLMEWSQLFGFTNNLIDATEEDLTDIPNKILPKVEAFISKLPEANIGKRLGIELTDFGPEDIEMHNNEVNNAKLNILIASSSDCNIGVGNLMKWPLEDVYEIVMHGEDGPEIRVKEEDNPDPDGTWYFIHDYTIV